MILVNPEKHPHVKAELGQAVHRLGALGPRASRRSPRYKINGQQLFFPNAKAGSS